VDVHGIALALTILAGIAMGPANALSSASGDAATIRPKRLLVIADHSTGNQTAHAAASHAVAVIERLGRETGAYVTTIRTDMALVTKSEVWGKGAYAKGGPRASRAETLDRYDAVLFYTNGETDLTDDQKRDLLGFIGVDGKGFVGVHSATATAYAWPGYAEMLGGVFDNHPWKVASAQIVVERPDVAAMKGWTTGMTIVDEHYQMRAIGYSRGTVDVLARLDPRSLDLSVPGVHRKDLDFPVAWMKRSGRGRVFYSTLGHTDASWDDPRIQSMYYQGILWALGSTVQDVRPHPK
jgi:type 1 glutamine amidotransferase